MNSEALEQAPVAKKTECLMPHCIPGSASAQWDYFWNRALVFEMSCWSTETDFCVKLHVPALSRRKRLLQKVNLELTRLQRKRRSTQKNQKPDEAPAKRKHTSPCVMGFGQLLTRPLAREMVSFTSSRLCVCPQILQNLSNETPKT